VKNLINSFPSVLILGFTDDLPLHVVVALDTETPIAFIITVYEPKKDLFGPDFRKRKEK
jgi:hypothetical protein